MQMNDVTLRYKLYEAAIETGISSNQYHELMTEGVLDWVKDALTSISAGKEMAGDLKNMFKDKKNQIIYKKATEEIQKSVAELFKAGAAAGVEKDQLKDWLLAGINKMTEDAAAAAPAAEKSSGKSDTVAVSTPQAAVEKGAPVQSVEQLAASASASVAAETGKQVEPEKVEAAAKKPEAFIDELVKKSGVSDKELVKKIVKALLDKRLIKSQVSITAENKQKSNKLILRSNEKILGEINLDYVKSVQKVLLEGPIKQKIESILKRSGIAADINYDRLVQIIKNIEGANLEEELKDADLKKTIESICDEGGKTVDDLKKELGQTSESSEKEEDSASLKKHEKVINGLGKEFSSNKKEIVKILDALGSFFTIDENKNNSKNIIIERWQKLAGIL
jgi:hypothetical protein